MACRRCGDAHWKPTYFIRPPERLLLAWWWLRDFRRDNQVFPWTVAWPLYAPVALVKAVLHNPTAVESRHAL